MIRRCALPLSIALLAPAVARAQITQEPAAPYPDARKFAHGLYAEAELGAVMFLGDAREPLGAGTAVGGRLGYDLLRWASLQVHAFASTHTTRFPGQPQTGQLLQFYQGTAELKLTAAFGQVSAHLFGGGGLARLSTNLLGTTGLTDPDVRSTPVFLGGAGVDYHPLTRHFSFGLIADFTNYQALHAPGAVVLTTYARYTF